MRVPRSLLALVSATSLATSAVGLAQAPTAPPALAAAAATKVVDSVRAALGGEKRLATVKNFVATGRTQQIQGENLVPTEFEISCELPDKCVRKDEVPARENGPTFIGFNADTLILLPPPATPLLEPARLGRLNTSKQDFARLMLGMFGASLEAYPVTFGYVGQAEAPQGKADVLDVEGPANFEARLFVNSDTHVPIMVTWQAAGRGTPPVENRLYYADYRDVSGLQLPFRLRRAVGPNTIEETTFDRFRINAKIDAKIFGVR